MVTGATSAQPADHAPGGPVAVLIGPPGAGKSTTARLLAELLGVSCADTDDLVEQRAGCDIPTLFVTEGEAAFRRLERACVAEALRTHPGVLALGGGAILDPDTQADLAGRAVAFLDVELRDAARRSGFDQGRPLMALNPRGQWLQLMTARRPVYQQLATIRVDTGGVPPDQVAHLVATGLGLRAGDG